MIPAETFRAQFEAALARRPFDTPRGHVPADLIDVFFGAPSRSHSVPPAWLYQRSGSDVEMVFQFYSNFTDHDLICKVVEAGGYPTAGEGASLQFNGRTSFRADGDSIAMRHRGLVTVGAQLSRRHLVELMSASCPAAMGALEIGAEAAAWPIELGTLRNIPSLIDRLFLYAYCIEQAKRSHRGDALLPAVAP